MSSPETKPPHDELTFNTLPNQLTLLRIAFVPVVVAILFLRDPFWNVMAGWVFAVASLTDWLDGYWARSQKIVTVYGKLLDPLADKFLVVSSLVMLQYLGFIHPVVVILLICREIAITGLRALASAEGMIIEASDSGKWKTITQMFAIPFLMAQDHLLGLPLGKIGMVLLYISLGISLWSAKDYIVAFFRALRERRKARQLERRHAREARLASRAARLAARAAKAAASPATAKTNS